VPQAHKGESQFRTIFQWGPVTANPEPERERDVGVFIKVSVDDEKCLGPEKSGECVRVCPVNIFEVRGPRVVVREENEDECILCNLCLDKCPASAIQIKKVYE